MIIVLSPMESKAIEHCYEMNVKTLPLSCDLYLQTSTKLGMIYSVTNQLSRKFGNLETGLFDWTQIGKKGWSSKKGIVIKLVYVFKSIDYAWQYFAQSMSQHCIFFLIFYVTAQCPLLCSLIFDMRINVWRRIMHGHWSVSVLNDVVFEIR